jgi:putative DNA methylase
VDKSRKTISFTIRRGGSKAELEIAKRGTKVGQAAFQCLISGAAITANYIDKAAAAGKMREMLIAIVAEGKKGKAYLSADDAPQLQAAKDAQKLVQSGAIDVQHLEAPCRGTFASNAQGRAYGFYKFRDYFLDRQLCGLSAFSDVLRELKKQVFDDAVQGGFQAYHSGLSAGGAEAEAYAEAVTFYLALALSKLADRGSTICTWDSSRGSLRNTFSQQGIAMTWDFAEGNPFSDATGSWKSCVGWITKVVELLPISQSGSVVQMDAQSCKYPTGTITSCDPPYYNNAGYADLSDFFYCWLRETCRLIYPENFDVITTPKADELVATPYRHGGKDAAEEFFLNGMRIALTNMAKNGSRDEFPTTIYYAFKQNEIKDEGISSTGWATFLQATIEAGYSINGTWPIRTEMSNRRTAAGNNSLANSVVLVCRAKPTHAEIISRSEFSRALKRELPAAIAELQAANIAPADMPQSAIGPGMGIFSRYRAVIESDDRPMSVKTALQLINHELDEYLGGIVGEFDADTRFAISWFEQNGMAKGDYGTANSIAQARGISADSAKHAGIVESAAGKVRILKREELANDWDPVRAIA